MSNNYSFLYKHKIYVLQFVFCLLFTAEIFSQANLIQSIDFDSQNRVVYALTGNYDSSYVVRYDNGNKEIWNLTQLFNQPFFWISSCVDNNDNIWAFMQKYLYKFDGSNWSQIPLPDSNLFYLKFSDLAVNDDYLFLTRMHASIYYQPALIRLKLSDNTWKVFDHNNSNYPENVLTGRIFIKGDSVFVGTTKGLVLAYGDSAKVILDTANSNLSTQSIFCFYIDSQNRKWLGTFDNGLIEWNDNFNFRCFNNSNSALPNNFINAIDEDSDGNLWLATDEGFACLKNDTIISYSNLVNSPIIEVKVDNQNRVWLGELGDGRLLVFDGNNLNAITDVSEEKNYSPEDFTLSQNYPNPFNPSTKIRYNIPSVILSSSKDDKVGVTLKVYDVLGNEVAILVNENKPAGVYEIEFNASKYNLTSGIYFYKLFAGSFVQTRKMILLK
jgi:sugar lactone lactonase YvrE